MSSNEYWVYIKGAGIVEGPIEGEAAAQARLDEITSAHWPEPLDPPYNMTQMFSRVSGMTRDADYAKQQAAQ